MQRVFFVDYISLILRLLFRLGCLMSANLTKWNYGLLSNDAIHLATMKKHGITSIATNDRDFERVEWLNIRKP